MTALNPSTDIPASCNTLEKLIVWANMVASELGENIAVVEGTNITERAFQHSPFLVTAVDPAEWRVISRSSIALNRQWRRGGDIWTYALEVSTSPIPTEYKS